MDGPLLAVGQSRVTGQLYLRRKTRIIPVVRDTMFALLEDSSAQEVQMERARNLIRLDLLPCMGATRSPLAARHYRTRHEDRDVSHGGVLVPPADSRCLDSQFLSTPVCVVRLGADPKVVAREGRWMAAAAAAAETVQAAVGGTFQAAAAADPRHGTAPIVLSEPL